MGPCFRAQPGSPSYASKIIAPASRWRPMVEQVAQDERVPAQSDQNGLSLTWLSEEGDDTQ